jgi:hypothetical protein
LRTTNSSLLWFTRRKRELDHAADDPVAVKCAGELAWPNGVLPPSGQLNRGADMGLVLDLLGHSSSTVRKQVYAHYQQRVLPGFDRCSALASEAVVEHEHDNALRPSPYSDAGYPPTTRPVASQR